MKSQTRTLKSLFAADPLFYRCRHLFFSVPESYYAAHPEVGLRRIASDSLFCDPQSVGFALSFLRERNAEAIPYPSFPEYSLIHLKSENPKGAVLVLPGGGYEGLSFLNEGILAAKAILSLGFDAYIAAYGVGDNAAFPTPVAQIAEAMGMIRKEQKKLFLLGFSAGGHLAGVSSLKWVCDRFSSSRPDGLILAYPVVSFLLPTHEPSKAHFLALHRDAAKDFSLEENIDPEFPKTYLWRAFADPIVPTIGADRLDENLTKLGIPHLYRVYEGDGHGWGVDPAFPSGCWLNEALAFLGR